MNRKWLFLLPFLVLGGAFLLLKLKPVGRSEVSARILRISIDPAGRRQVVYEITNGTSHVTGVTVYNLETRDSRTGWWNLGGSQTGWKVEKSSGVTNGVFGATLNAFSASQFEIALSRFGDPEQSVALRARALALRIESRTILKFREIVYRLRLPKHWRMESKGQWIDLPEAKLSPRLGLPRVPAPAPLRSNAAPVVALSQSSEDIVPAGMIKFQNVDLRTALNIYAELANANLDIDIPVRKLPARITLQNTEALKLSEAVQLFEQVFQQQAAIVVEHLDNDRISVRLRRGP